jgi:hypothetical protein
MYTYVISLAWQGIIFAHDLPCCALRHAVMSSPGLQIEFFRVSPKSIQALLTHLDTCPKGKGKKKVVMCSESSG